MEYTYILRNVTSFSHSLLALFQYSWKYTQCIFITRGMVAYLLFCSGMAPLVIFV